MAEIYLEIYDLAHNDEGWCEYLGKKPAYECEFTHDNLISLDTPSILRIESLFKKHRYSSYSAKETKGHGHITVTEIKKIYPFLTFSDKLNRDFSIHYIQAVRMDFYRNTSFTRGMTSARTFMLFFVL